MDAFKQTTLLARSVTACALILACVVAGCATAQQDGQPKVAAASSVRSALSKSVKKQKKALRSVFHREPAAGPHLGQIYSRAASHHDGHRNPVIVIPGILGSRLRDADSNRVVWGSFGAGNLNPVRANDAALLALPMQPSVPLRDLRDHDTPDSILADAKVSLFGIPIQVEAYHGILETLGVGGFQADASGRATIDSIAYGEDHFTCFEFHYDWRRDNAENAARLGQFMREKAEYVQAVRAQRFGVIGEPVKFDLVAHSMGGLLARYYMRYGEQQLGDDGSLPPLTWEGARNVDLLIQVGTPNAGSPKVLQDLVNGKRLAPFLPKYSAAILGTMPAPYQLMPRPRHAAVVCDGHPQGVDLYDVNVWQHFGWGLLDPDQDHELQKLLPHVETRQQRHAIAYDHVAKSLLRAKQLHQALDQPASPPAGTSMYLVAGDSIDTTSRLAVNPQTGRLSELARAPGDGTVLRTSALMDERLSDSVPWQPKLVSPVNWRHTTFIFASHEGLTSDPGFTDNVLNLLLESPR